MKRTRKWAKRNSETENIVCQKNLLEAKNIENIDTKNVSATQNSLSYWTAEIEELRFNGKDWTAGIEQLDWTAEIEQLILTSWDWTAVLNNWDLTDLI